MTQLCKCNGMADPLNICPPHMYYYGKFCLRSTSTAVGVSRGTAKIGEHGLPGW